MGIRRSKGGRQITRGNLGDNVLKRINEQLPEALPLKKRTFDPLPDFVSMNFPYQSRFPIATVCFEDAAEVLCEVRIALHEYYAHSEYYRRVTTPPRESVAICLERFYLDDAALRLYAAGEHLGVAIEHMLEIDPEALREYKGVTSRQAAVGLFLADKLSWHPLTLQVRRLRDSRAWCETRRYRDEWVHKKPPPIQGTGIVYLREVFWERDDNGSWRLPIGQKFTPELTIDAIHDFVRPAYDLFLEVLAGCLDHYDGRLRDAGFVVKRGVSDNTPYEGGPMDSQPPKNPDVAQVAAPSGAAPRFREVAADALRYWEPRRVLYNVVLLGVVAARFFSVSQRQLPWNTFLMLVALAVLANVCYCAAYAIDIFVQYSALRATWARWRWVILLVGIIFGSVIAHFISMAMFADPYS